MQIMVRAAAGQLHAGRLRPARTSAPPCPPLLHARARPRPHPCPLCRLLQLGGFLVNPESIPAWIAWVRYLSPMSYALEAMASNEMADDYYTISVDGFGSIGGVQVRCGAVGAPPVCCY